MADLVGAEAGPIAYESAEGWKAKVTAVWHHRGMNQSNDKMINQWDGGLENWCFEGHYDI